MILRMKFSQGKTSQSFSEMKNLNEQGREFISDQNKNVKNMILEEIKK